MCFTIAQPNWADLEYFNALAVETECKIDILSYVQRRASPGNESADKILDLLLF